MRKRDEDIPLLFEDRKKDDIIHPDYYNNLFQKPRTDNENKGNLAKDSKNIKTENDLESNDASTQEYNQLNIITIPHSAVFILFLSLLIGLSVNTLLSFVFPIYTESSFKDHIPNDLNIHGFKIGSAYFDGIIRDVNKTKFVYIEIPSGFTIDLEANSNEFYVSTQDTTLFTNSEKHRGYPSFLNMETHLVKSNPLNIANNIFMFNAEKLITSDSFQLMGKIDCKSLIYKGYLFKADGTCMNATSDDTNITDSHSKTIKSFLQNLQLVDDFGIVNNYIISYPYIAVSDNEEMRIYKYENEGQFIVDNIKGRGNLYKHSNSNNLIYGQYLYRIVNDKIEKVDSFIRDIDYENETIDNDGNKIFVTYNKTGIYYIQCDRMNCNQQKSLLIHEFNQNIENTLKLNPFDLKISIDQFGSPVITSNSLKMAFLIDGDNNSIDNIILDVDEKDNIDDIRMLSHSNQLLYLSNHTLSRYLI